MEAAELRTASTETANQPPGAIWAHWKGWTGHLLHNVSLPAGKHQSQEVGRRGRGRITTTGRRQAGRDAMKPRKQGLHTYTWRGRALIQGHLHSHHMCHCKALFPCEGKGGRGGEHHSTPQWRPYCIRTCYIAGLTTSQWPTVSYTQRGVEPCKVITHTISSSMGIPPSIWMVSVCTIFPYMC